MSERADAIADRVEQGGEALAAFVEGLSETQWQTVIPNEERTVAALVHHVAGYCVPLVEWAQGVAAGKAITGVTWDDIAQMNAQHAQEHATAAKQETIKMLRTNTKAAADMVRKFTDDELDTAAPVCLYWDTPLSAQFFIEFHSVRHNYSHLDSIQAVFNGNV